MERSSDSHGPRIDEDLERLTESVTRGAPVESRAEEEREQEGPADGEPVVDGVSHPTDGQEAGEDVELRSELARHIEPSVFPCARDAVLLSAQRQRAPTDVLQRLEQLPEGQYTNIEAVWEALGGRRDRRDTPST